MTLLADAETWASAGIDDLFDEYVEKPQEFTRLEVEALVRAAYTVGYVDGCVGEADHVGLPILRACQFAAALRLTLPLSSY